MHYVHWCAFIVRFGSCLDSSMPSHEFADFRVDYNTAASDAPLSLRGTKDKVPGLLKTFNVFHIFLMRNLLKEI